MSSWDHSCELDVSTLRLLYERQKANLRTLFYTRLCFSEQRKLLFSDQSILRSAIRGIHSLSVESMDLDRGRCWMEATMVIQNAGNLNHLRLGFISRIAHDFALMRRPQYDKMSTLFSAAMEVSLFNLNLSEVHLSLGSLHLCGLNLGSVLQGKVALNIDFTKVTQLRLESCPGLSQAFSILMDPAGPPTSALGALEDLFIRVENPDSHFSNSLQSFLKSFHGLIHLRVLVDNALSDQDLTPILDIHGQTLRTLVWDERSGPRTRLDASTSLLSTGLRKLKVVSQKCRSLTTLGIALDWEAMISAGIQVTQQSFVLNRNAQPDRF